VIRAEVRVDFDHLPKIAAGLEPAVYGLIAAELETARGDARQAAPVRTGRLRDSIVVEKILEGWALVAGVSYAMLVELGARGRAARPFLQPAFQRALIRVGERLPLVLGRLV
jgi:hypothetical protein